MSWIEKPIELPRTEKALYVLKDSRSYKDVLLGYAWRFNEGIYTIESPTLPINNVDEEDPFRNFEKMAVSVLTF